MTLNQLAAFLATARTGSFTAAAGDLAISQASVSESIRRLEEELGMPLFTRGPRRVVLTAAGTALLPYAEQATAAADGGRQAVQALATLGTGVATFGMLRNADFYLLSDLVEQFLDRHPDLRVRMVGLNSVETAAAVAEGELEAGLVVLPIDDDGLTVTPLLRDEVRYVSADPARTRRPVSLEDFSRARLVLYDAHYGWRDPTRRQLLERAQLAGLKLAPWIEVEHVESALHLVSRGVGDTVVSGAVIASNRFPAELTSVRFADPLYDTIALVQRENAVLSPATSEFAQLARRMLLARRRSTGGVSGRRSARRG
ncbi:LysR family transcriptional regulator [Nakamurella endophytica]|uniref:LysR family transcriptional regulator n=1 Tax=Nakamurella endophytica TaxID=1748367 RepID=A0A917WHQ2_9ACTN|nr:LysR family transcriptional regulator [Nakamurella endophytica]GGM04963.1 LysR family transcriptional regulator [Nakamurella endophytica]